MLAGPLTDTLGIRVTAGVTEREADKDYTVGSGTTGSENQNYNAMLHYQPTDQHNFSLEMGHSIQKIRKDLVLMRLQGMFQKPSGARVNLNIIIIV